MKSRVHLPILAFALVLASPEIAFAAPGPTNDPAAAQVLFYEARSLMKQERYAEACPKLEESLRLDAGLGTRFNLADCNEHIGKIATAWAGFLEVAAEAKATGQHEREKVARKRALALEPRLPKLVIDAPNASPDLSVMRDDKPIGTITLGTAIPVDPGVHRVTATAPGKQWQASVTTSEGTTTRVAVPRDLPDAPAEIAGASAAARTTVTSANASTDLPPPAVETTGTAQRTAGWVLTGVGAASLAVGAGFGFSSIARRSDARSHCVGDSCDAEGVHLRDAAIRSGNVSTVAFIAGGVAVASGMVLVLFAPTGRVGPERPAGMIRAVPTFAGSSGGLFLQGSFR